jgi:hypothetical protein
VKRPEQVFLCASAIREGWRQQSAVAVANNAEQSQLCSHWQSVMRSAAYGGLSPSGQLLAKLLEGSLGDGDVLLTVQVPVAFVLGKHGTSGETSQGGGLASHVPFLQNSVSALQVLLQPPQFKRSLAKLCMNDKQLCKQQGELQ